MVIALRDIKTSENVYEAEVVFISKDELSSSVAEKFPDGCYVVKRSFNTRLIMKEHERLSKYFEGLIKIDDEITEMTVDRKFADKIVPYKICECNINIFLYTTESALNDFTVVQD